MQLFVRFFAEEDGLETVEYAIMTGAIVIATLAVLTLIGNWVVGTFTTFQAGLP